MSAARPSSTLCLGAELERDRLERRATRVTVAIAALRKRASQHRPGPGAPPRHLRQAIADFEAQIESMNARLRELASDPGDRKSRNRVGQMKTVAALDTAVGRRAINQLLDGYVSWREECQAVAFAHGRLIASDWSERQLVYAAYFASLEREEHAAHTYAHHVERVTRTAT